MSTNEINRVELVYNARQYQNNPKLVETIQDVEETPTGTMKITTKDLGIVWINPDLLSAIDAFIKDTGGKLKPDLGQKNVLKDVKAKFDAQMAKREASGGILEILRRLIHELSNQRAELQQALDSSRTKLMMMEYKTTMAQASEQAKSAIWKGVIGGAVSAIATIKMYRDYSAMAKLDEEIMKSKEAAAKVEKDGIDPATNKKLTDNGKADLLKNYSADQEKFDREFKTLWAGQSALKAFSDLGQSSSSTVGGTIDAAATREQATLALLQATRTMTEGSVQYALNMSVEAQKTLESSAAAFNQTLQQTAQVRA